MALAIEGRTLHVRGRIDRLDVVDGVVVLRDLKTGRPYPRLGRAADPDPGLDVQVDLYGLVVRRWRGTGACPRGSPPPTPTSDAAAPTSGFLTVLMQAVEGGTPGAELLGSPAAARAEGATRTILGTPAAGIEADSKEQE